MAIRTAVLGYGRNGSTMHAGAIERNPNFQMTAVCDIDPDRRRQAMDRFGCRVYEDYHEMLAKEELDLVCVITRSHQHSKMTCDCLEAGVNVLVTKPWAVNEGEALNMIKAAKTSGRLLLPWLPSRWGSTLRRLKQLIREDVIGQVFMVRRAVNCFGTRNDWQIERQYGGGYLLNWGPHIVDPPVVLMDSKVKSVYGRMKQTINPGDTEDMFLAVMTLENGCVIQAEHAITAEAVPDWFIQGDKGTIVVYGNDLMVHKSIPPKPDDPTQYAGMASTGSQIVKERVPGNQYGDEDEIYVEIYEALKAKKEYPVNPADALELTRTFDAIRRSSETNRVVEL